MINRIWKISRFLSIPLLILSAWSFSAQANDSLLDLLLKKGIVFQLSNFGNLVSDLPKARVLPFQRFAIANARLTSKMQLQGQPILYHYSFLEGQEIADPVSPLPGESIEEVL